ncbi:FAD-binding oxidoreductase [Candidatus Woesearchaeota archaeon]|nr:FAD-binding oxidoreductase [Candidatus Woesearchaeota archaeon]
MPCEASTSPYAVQLVVNAAGFSPQQFTEGIQRVLSEYFSLFRTVKIKASDAGSYSYQVDDNQPFVDWVAPGLMVVGGDSGSGIMKADAIGRVAAALFGCGYKRENGKIILLHGNVPFDISLLTKEGRKKSGTETFVI